MLDLRITLFGPPCAERDGVPVPFGRHQTLALLAYLAATDQPHGRDALAALFWPELDKREAHAALRRILHDLGRTIGKGWLECGDGRVALPARPGLHVDVRRFHALVAQGEAHGHASQTLCDDCLVALTEAVGLYRDDFLAGFTLKGSAEFDAWQTLTTESLRLELAAALAKLMASLADRQQYDLALPHARRRLVLNPLDETSHRWLIQLYASSGDRAAAARQYEECVRVLAAELGIEPALETTVLYHELLRSKPAVGTHGAVDRLEVVLSATGSAPAPPPASQTLPPSILHNLPADLDAVHRPTGCAEPGRGAAGQPGVPAAHGPRPWWHRQDAIGHPNSRESMVDRFSHGVYFVDLALISSAELLSAAILRTLQAPQQALEPDEQLLALLRDRHMLLVLDNYEHLLTGPDPDRRDGYGLVSKMVAAAPQLKLLVTSRARLKAPAEWLAPLDGLESPPPSPSPQPSPWKGEGDLTPLPGGERAGEGRSVESPATGPRRKGARDAVARLRRYSATVLFLECVRRLRPGFRPTAAEAQTIADICRLLEGVPLAIEMAAAWTRVLPLDEIASRLEHGLLLLTTPLRGVPERQRSMVATFDHSWRLLTAAERSILRQLSVFRGGFTLEAAETVAGAGLNDLANLVDASWLGLTPSGRYAIHELVRQYCADKLENERPAEAGESRDQVRRRHALYFADILASHWHQIFRRKGTITELAPDMGNLMAAWDWALAADDLQLARGLGNGLGCLANRQGQNPEIAQVLGLGVERLRTAQTAERGGRERWRQRAIVLAMVLTNQSERFARLSRLDDTEACLAEAADWLAEAEAGDAAWAEARWFYHRMVAWTRYDRGDFAGSMQMWSEVLTALQMGQVALWPYKGDVAAIWLPETYWGRGLNALAVGDFAEARRLAEQGVAIAEQLGLGLAPGFASHLLAWALLSTGDYERADQAARRFLGIANSYGESLMTAMAFSVLGRTQFRLWRYDEARTWWRRGLALARKTGLRGSVTACLTGLGDIELAIGNVAAAQRLYEQCLAAAGQPQPAGRPHTDVPPGALPALIGLGQVALRQCQPAAARERFRQVLRAPSRRAATTAEALVYTAETLVQEDELEQAAKLCGFLSNWSGAPRHVTEVVERLLGEMAGQLPPQELGAALRRGEIWGLDEVMAQVYFTRS